MSDTRTNAPKIRFSGFTEDWEQRELGKHLVPYNEVTTKNNQYPVFTSSRKGLFFQKDYYDGNQIASEDNTGYNIVPRGYFTYRHMSDDLIFKFNINDIADKGIVSTLYPVFSTTDDLDSKYLQYQLNEGQEFKRFAILQKQGGSRTYMYLSKLKNMIISLPKYDEQIKISTFFKQLDDTIALHQRELDLLKQTKQTYLQKMFPKSGENKPEIRFAGFTDSWEQRKAKEIFISKVEKNHPELPVLSVTQDSGVLYRNQLGIDIKYDRTTLKNYKVIRKGDFIISLRSFQGGFELSDKLGITSPAYTIFVPKNMNSQDSLFWKIKFKTFTFIESLKTVTFGIRDGKAISFSEFGDLKLFFPKNIEEQQKIGTFFKRLDDTIALHQRKLDSLKEMKKSLLQQMFV